MNEPFIAELAQYMQERALGTLGTDIFVGELPESVTAGFMLVNAPSPDPHEYIDHEKIVVDFWYRTPHTKGAYTKIREAFNTFHRAHHYRTANWYVYYSQALGNIKDFDRDGEGGKLLSLSIQFTVRNLNNLS